MAASLNPKRMHPNVDIVLELIYKNKQIGSGLKCY